MTRIKNLNIDKIESIEYQQPVRSNSKITITYRDEDGFPVEETYERKDIENLVYTYFNGYILVHITNSEYRPETFQVLKLKGYNVLDEPIAFGEYGLRTRKNMTVVFENINELPMLIELYK